MKILIVGSGAREYAIGDKIKSQREDEVELFFAPGNGATSKLGQNENIPETEVASLLIFAEKEKIDYCIIGPEAPLCAGITDAFERAGIKVFGPNKKCAKLEGSKEFTKEVLQLENIPTANYKTFIESDSAIEFAKKLRDENLKGKVVLKADGLAAGKGVLIASTDTEIENGIKNVLENKIFGEQKLLIEEFLWGFETSLIGFFDGETLKVFNPVRDHKTIYEGNIGPNTGGMGTFTPDFEALAYKEEIEETILKPFIKAMKKAKLDYKGIVFLGLIVSETGPRVLEINCRFGDPETQALMMSIESDLLDIMMKTTEGNLKDAELVLNDKKIVNVVLASGGYPDKYKKGFEIFGLDKIKDEKIFYGGVSEQDGKLYTNGGRVLSICAAGDNFDTARINVYKDVKKINFEGVTYRKDIAPMVKRVYVWKKEKFDVPSNSIKNLLTEEFGKEFDSLQLYRRYDIEGLDDTDIEIIKDTILREPPVDNIAIGVEALELQKEMQNPIVIRYKAGQFDQREKGLLDTIKAVLPDKEVKCVVEEVISISDITADELKKIKKTLINPVDQEEGDLLEIPSTLNSDIHFSNEVVYYREFKDLSEAELESFHDELSLAMSVADLKTIQDYCKSEDKDPTDTEISILDTYWSDHCRHTTFFTQLEEVSFEDSNEVRDKKLKEAFEKYIDMKKEAGDKKPVSLMNMSTIQSKLMRKEGKLSDVEVSDEINACTLIIPAHVDGKEEEYLLFFKNETHNHPTEIEPFGGAQTCLGGAIRDPLSGRGYVYQAMRITGASDPINDYNIEGKLSQKKIVRDALRGYSSYGNQIGLATGYVDELFHSGYKAKRMEVGAVIGAAPKKNVKKIKPQDGDVVILLGGRTGRDGVGGATGSSKVHTIESVRKSGAEVQKGHAPTERKIQRLMRRPEATILIKKCNDFGAGGVSVAIGELADSLDIYLDRVPLKYKGLSPREIAISESQERMAVVIAKKDLNEFLRYANEENLEATYVADVTNSGRVRMFFNDVVVCDMSREFMNSTGAIREQVVEVKKASDIKYFDDVKANELNKYLLYTIGRINNASKKNLLENFDFSVGRATVNMPLGGKNELTPINSMVAKIPSKTDDTNTVSYMSFGFIPELSSEDPFVGSYYAVLLSVLKLVATGAKYERARLSYQEYFEKLGEDPEKWQKPFIALLGALKASTILETPAIGGKDSMSGTFEDIHVPPTLISFAVSYGDKKYVTTSELKGCYKLGLVQNDIDENGFIDEQKFLDNLKLIEKEIENGNIVTAYVVDRENVLLSLLKMSFGNDVKFVIDINTNELLNNKPLDVIVEYKDNVEGIKEIGKSGTEKCIVNYEEIDYYTIKDVFVHGLDPVYGKEMETETKDLSFNDSKVRRMKSLKLVDKPRVTIAVFEGTNSEYDSRLAFEKAGAEVREVMIRNITNEMLEESLDDFAESIRNSQILFIPGGFSMSDEPDGSAKFIANVLRNKKVESAIEHLLDENGNDGLILGICNGFQALIKTGLLPYGKVTKLSENDPTLTYNEIGRHISKIIPTKPITTDSPWLKYIDKDTIYNVPISHGEGRFIANQDVIDQLIDNNQIAFKYVVNPNGSSEGIEAIMDKSGKILGKMGHSERVSADTYKNFGKIEIENLFKAGVDFFK
ncbi:MAG: phosphoribosylformylglycinamidine synthase [Ezakiella sp.]|nr:phosphoribosylformylglycinamidine synthase [Ezakiella sp.]MDD7471837.1 phosphoribosylformylglycinamidine synthase [Bacillota bacterium]MDY3923801.1 phosphoribosylformylglycinamidine synthase [Ezakiella sp.]